MQNYNNYLFNGIKNNIRTNPAFKSGEVKLPENTESSKKEQGAAVSDVIPDYNISLPMGYTKTGVEKLSNGQEIHCYKLNNGQRVYIAPKESANTVLNTYVNTGALNEKDEERGISHFCEHMAFNGTKGTNGYIKLGKGDVFKMVANMGGYTNASTGYAETNYTISIPKFKSEDFENIVKIQASMMNNLEMSDEMTEKEHAPVTSEINMYADMPDVVISNAALKNLYNIKTTSDDIVAGRVDNILNVDSKKVSDYFKNNYYPANMTTVVTGNVNPDEAINIIAKHFKGETPQNPDRQLEELKPIETTVRKDILSPKAVATSGCICFNGPQNNDLKGNIEVMVLNQLLFNKKHSIVSKALEPYSVEVEASTERLRTQPNDNMFVSLNYTTTEENSEIALKSIFDKIANFEPPNQEDMETLKTSLKMMYEKRYEDTEKLNYLIGGSSLNGGIEGCVDAINVIDSLTADDLTDAVHKYYNLNKASIAVIHPETVTAQNLSDNYKKAGNISFKGNIEKRENKRKPVKDENVLRYKLSNNCDMAITSTSGNTGAFSACITAQIPADTKPGVKELLEEILLKASDDDVKLLDKNNIDVYTGAGNNHMYYEAEFPAKNTSTALKLMKKRILSPEFNEANFEKSKQNLKTELMTAQPSAYDNAKNDLFPNSTRGYSRSDILKNLDNISLSEVMGLHKYLTDNGGFTFAAALPTQKYPAIKDVVAGELSEMPVFKENKPEIFNDYQPIKSSKVIKDVSNMAQADVVQIYKFPKSANIKEIVAYKLMNSILSRGEDTGLFNNLREKEKLAYSVSSSLDISNMKSGCLICNILTTTDSNDLKSYDNVKKSIQGFTRQIDKIKAGEFTDSEFEAAKLGLKRNLLESFDTTVDKVTTLSEGLRNPNGITHNNMEYDILDSLTKDDIKNAANHIFKNPPIYSVRATKDTLDANNDFFESLNNG